MRWTLLICGPPQRWRTVRVGANGRTGYDQSDALQITRNVPFFDAHFRQSQTNLKHPKQSFPLQRTIEIKTDNLHNRTMQHLDTTYCTVQSPSWEITGLQLVKKFPAFHGTRRFITALTRVRHLSLSWASPIQSIYPHPNSCRSILILSTHLHLCFPSGLLPSGFPSKTLYTPSPNPYVPHAQPISFFSILSPAQYWVSSTSHLAPRYADSSIPTLPRHS